MMMIVMQVARVNFGKGLSHSDGASTVSIRPRMSGQRSAPSRLRTLATAHAIRISASRRCARRVSRNPWGRGRCDTLLRRRCVRSCSSRSLARVTSVQRPADGVVAVRAGGQELEAAAGGPLPAGRTAGPGQVCGAQPGRRPGRSQSSHAGPQQEPGESTLRHPHGLSQLPLF